MKNNIVILIILLCFVSGYNLYLNVNYNDLRKQYETLEIVYYTLIDSYTKLNKTHNDLQNHYNILNSSFYELKNKYSILNESHIILKKDYSQLNESHNLLQKQYLELNASYEEIREKFSLLNKNYEEIRIKLRDLEGNYDSLKKNYEYLTKQYEFEYSLKIGNTLQNFYDLLRREAEERYFSKGSKGALQFCVNLALFNLGRISFSRFEEEYKKLTGETPQQASLKIIEKVIKYIGFDGRDTETDKIAKILKFINEYVHYEVEINDVFLAPVETLTFRSGDCDDFSILAACLLEYVGIETAIGTFENDKGELHSMILVHLNDLEGYEYFFYENLQSLGLKSGKWIVIEPQYRIENQKNDWIKQWKLVIAIEVG